MMRYSIARMLHAFECIGAARAACWGILKSTYSLSKYEDLPIDKYAACVAFIKKACADSTGVALDLPEQAELGLES